MYILYFILAIVLIHYNSKYTPELIRKYGPKLDNKTDDFTLG